MMPPRRWSFSRVKEIKGIPISAIIFMSGVVTLFCVAFRNSYMEGRVTHTHDSHSPLRRAEAYGALAAVKKMQYKNPITTSIHEHAMLMAPLLFPQLYPKCGRIEHPPLPTRQDDIMAKAKAQGKEDIILYENLFKDYERPGVFLEIGALDGNMYSNTYFFEHALGWRGILVEPQPQNSERLMKADRPRTARFPIGACNITSDREPGELKISTQGGPVATSFDYASPGFMAIWKEVVGKEDIAVPCVPLQYIIEATGMLDIDLFSLDVEGGEMAVLETVDLEVTNINAILIEMDGSNPEKDEMVRKTLIAHGFEVSQKAPRFGINNELFVNPKFEARRAARDPLPIKC